MLLRLLVAAQGSLNPAWPAKMPWNYEISYMTIGEKRCNMADFGNYLEVFSDATDVPALGATIQSKLCAQGDAGYCGSGSHCDGDDATMGANFAFCGTERECKQACDASSECYGIEVAQGANRCYLLRRECQTALLKGELNQGAAGAYKYLAKMDRQELSGAELCPLGTAVVGYGMQDPSMQCELNGQYDPVEGDDGRYLGPGGCSTLAWSGSGCGWEVRTAQPAQDEADFVQAVTGCREEAATCRNDVEAANWIFGYAVGSAGYMEDICDVTAAWLDDPGYCGNAAWRALCPESCVGWEDFIYPQCPCADWTSQDNEPAAEYVATMLGLVARDGDVSLACTNLESMCSTDGVAGDLVVDRICANRCASTRRLSPADKQKGAALSKRAQSTLRRLLSSGFRKDLDGLARVKAERRERQLKGDRKLQAAHGRALYATWPVVSKAGLACADFTPDQAASTRPRTQVIDETDALFDIHALTVAVDGFTVTEDCPPQRHYTTESGTFCTTNNLPVAADAQAYAEAHAETCWSKCLAQGSSGTAGVDGSGPDGLDYCSGADTAYNQFSNALCVPREECERLCDLYEDCVGFEMHTAYPRCYLNRAPCGVHEIPDAQYDSATKVEQSVSYKSHTSKSCDSGKGPLSYKPPLVASMDLCENKCAHAADQTCSGYQSGKYDDWACLPREVCEEKCTADPDCAGFEVTKGYDPVSGQWVAPQACSFRKLDGPRQLCSEDALFDGSPIANPASMTYTQWSPAKATNNQAGGSEYVEKRLTAGKGAGRYITPCRAKVEGSPHGYDGLWQPQEAGTGDCQGLSYAGDCYASDMGATLRLAWAGDAAFDERQLDGAGRTQGLDRRFDGWVVQHKGDQGYESKYAYDKANLQGCADSPTFLDMGGWYDCAGWAGDCSKSSPLYRTDCAGTTPGPDLVACEIGGWGPDSYGYFYSKEFMDNIRENCPVSCDACGAQLGPHLTGSDDLYPWFPPLDEHAGLDYTCLTYQACGTLSTCVLPYGRFRSELAGQYRNHDSTQRIVSLPDSARSEIFDPVTFKPKTLISVERATAFVGAEKVQWAEELYRNVPGHLRIRLTSLGDAEKAVITMVSASSDGQMKELGTMYAPPPTHEPWYTDLIRVERFKTQGAMGKMVLDVYAPIDGELELLHVDHNNDRIACAKNSYSAPGWWSCDIEADGDYIGTTQAACPTFVAASDPNNGAELYAQMAHCDDTAPGAECQPACADGYAQAGALVCELGQWQGLASHAACAPKAQYGPEDSFFRLTHRSRMDYGWRIQGVEAYSDEDCTMPVGVDPDYQSSSETQGGFGHFDGGSEWWSKQLNVNPYVVDETHHGAVHLDFRTTMADVRCVVVLQRSVTPARLGSQARQYYPSEQVLARGWKFNPRQAADFDAKETSLHGWTQVWLAEEGPEPPNALDGVSKTVFRPTCGIYAVIYGELIKAQEGVDSSCGCRQLCIDTDQCVSWKWRQGTCHLQSNLVSIEGQSEACATTEWISGDTGTRFATGQRHTGVAVTHEAASIQVEGSWDDFTLSLHGINFPTEPTAKLHKTTAPRQRIKIVPEGEACAESQIAPGVDGIGCSHAYFCTPRPTTSGANGLSWAGLSIQKDTSAKTYEVCYSAGDTASRWSWHHVGQLNVPGSQFVWSTEPAAVTRRTAAFALSVHGDMLADGGLGLRLKVLQPGVDDCSLASVAAFGINATSADEFGDDMASATWLLSSPSSWDAASESYTGVGSYTVCLSQDEGDTWYQIPSKASLLLDVAAEEDDSSHPRKVFFAQRLSGRHGATAALTLAGHRLRLPSTSAVRLAADCGALENATEAVRVNEAESSAGGYVFDVELDTEALSVQVCYCDDQTDDTPNATATGTYKVSTNKKCTAASAVESDTDATATGNTTGAAIAKADTAADFQDHFCQAKCARGCVGADCHCDEYDPVAQGVEGAYGPLCVDPVLCRAACEATAGCAGFDFEPAKSFCWLYRSCDADDAAEQEGIDSWAKQAGGSCTDAADFVSVGTLDLTKRPFVDHDWVLEPGAEASIEVLGENLDFHTDRIMVIDSTGTCGITGPTASAQHSQYGYNHWVAKNAFSDPPATGDGCTDNPTWRDMFGYECIDWVMDCNEAHAITDCAGTTPGADGVACEIGGWGPDFYGYFYSKDFMDDIRANCPASCDAKADACDADSSAADLVWIEREQSYCSGNNIPAHEMVGDNAKHTCHAKCVTGAPCDGDDCFCDGLYPGYDKEDSSALCLDLAGCKAACTRDESCFGFDMNTDMNRCFLNRGESSSDQSCAEQVQLGQLASIDHYSFWFKHPAERRARKLERRDDRRLLAVEDGGLSWPQMLRFTGISFSTGGTFTACFCDSHVHDGSSIEVCKSPKDYKVAVGTVHVSGVECLLQHKKFQRGTCVNHFPGHGGMRCYPGDAPAVQYPSPAEMEELVFPDADDAPAPSHLSSFCLYGPEEETRDNPLCQWPTM